MATLPQVAAKAAAGPSPGRPFKLGFVMAGAVSAGAYTAGVFDFLVQALDAWEADRGAATVPQHRVQIDVMSGASAGGMCASILAIALSEPFQPVTDPMNAADGNKLFHAWVKQVDLAPLLDTDDITPGQPPVAALNGKILETIRDDAMIPAAETQRRRYVAESMHVVLTTTNLRGVPYHIEFQGGDTDRPRPHYMTLHADFVHFEVEAPGAAVSFAPEPHRGLPLPRADLAEKKGFWKLFGDSALATGAFPVGLPPRCVAVPPTAYTDRRWRVLTDWHDLGDTFTAAGVFRAIPPDWADPKNPPNPYSYVAVDGGAMDNEPVTLARVLLPENADSTSVNGVQSALVMIDPFPSTSNPASSAADLRFANLGTGADALTIVDVVMQLIQSFVEQCRFMPGEIERANNPAVYDQYLIGPTDPTRDHADQPLACGGLGGFMGFLDEEFRRHDYALGRRNGYDFVFAHLTFPLYEADGSRAALFAEWSAAALKEHATVRVRTPGSERSYGEVLTGDAARAAINFTDPDRPVPLNPEWHVIFVPLIPLCGAAREQPPMPAWPTWERRVAARQQGRENTARTRKEVHAMIKPRLTAVLDAFVARLGGGVGGWVARRALYLAVWLKADGWVDQILDKVAADLRSQGLIGDSW